MEPANEMWWEADLLCLWVAPCEESEARRRAISDHIRDVLVRAGVQKDAIRGVGSFPSKTYLPDADIDLTILGHPGDSDEATFLVNSALCRTAVLHSPMSSAGQPTRPAGAEQEGTAVAPAPQEAMLHVRNVTFIAGKVRVVTCVVGNLSVDVSVGKYSAVAAVALLERADEALGADALPPLRRQRLLQLPQPAPHIVKRSILLTKCWCLYESAPLSMAMTGVEARPVLASHAGRLSSYAVSVMVLALLNETLEEREAYRNILALQAAASPPSARANGAPKKGRRNRSNSPRSGGGGEACAIREEAPSAWTAAAEGSAALAVGVELRHPLAVLARFLRVFSQFDWSSYALTIDGPVPLRPQPSELLPLGVSCAGRPGSCTAGPRTVPPSAKLPTRPLSAALSRIRPRPEPGPGRLAEGFPIRPGGMHIVDPLDPANNLAAGLSRYVVLHNFTNGLHL